MKRICILAVFYIVTAPLFGQTIDKAKEFLKANKLPEAQNKTAY